jgi:hypothetical protein
LQTSSLQLPAAVRRAKLNTNKIEAVLLCIDLGAKAPSQCDILSRVMRNVSAYYVDNPKTQRPKSRKKSPMFSKEPRISRSTQLLQSVSCKER